MHPPVGHIERVEVQGRELDVWLAGDAGPTVLLIHGIPTNHRLWWDVVPALYPHARVVAPDLLGYGGSDGPSSPRGHGVDLASQASLLVDLLDALGRREAAVVGHDLGGGIAQIMAVTSGDRVSGMAVVNGVCYDAWPVPLVRPAKATWPLLSVMPPAALVRTLPLAMRPLFGHAQSARKFIPRFAEPWSRPDGPRLLAQHVRALDSVYTQTVAPFLGRLAMPVEIVWGRLDRQLKPRYGERLGRDIPGAQLTWVPDANHFVPADRPDVVAKAVLALIRRL